MATFFMRGNYSSEAMGAISAGRTEQAVDLIKGYGGVVKAMYALLGEYDLVFIVELEDTDKAIKTSIALSILTGISFTTAPAMSCTYCTTCSNGSSGADELPCKHIRAPSAVSSKSPAATRARLGALPERSPR